MAQASPPALVPPLFALRCAIAYAAALGVNGVLLPFFPVWLKTLDFDDLRIGLILSLPILLRIVAAPLASLLADRLAERSRVLVFSSLTSIVLAAALLSAREFWPVLVIFCLQGAAFSPFTPVLESITVTGVRRWGLKYGSIRVWGSIGFVATTLLAGQAVTSFSGAVVPLAAALAFLLSLVAALIVPKLGPSTPRPVSAAPSVATGHSLRLLMIGATLVQSTHGMYYSFSGIQWQQMGFSGRDIGLLWTSGVVAEILFFFVSGAVARRVSPKALILFGAGVAVVRWCLFTQPLGLVASLALQCTHAFTFAFLHFGIQQKIVEHVHESRESAVQGSYVFYSGAFLAASTFLSGALYRHFGQDAYYAMALIAAAGLCLCWMASANQPQRPASGG